MEREAVRSSEALTLGRCLGNVVSSMHSSARWAVGGLLVAGMSVGMPDLSLAQEAKGGEKSSEKKQVERSKEEKAAQMFFDAYFDACAKQGLESDITKGYLSDFLRCGPPAAAILLGHVEQRSFSDATAIRYEGILIGQAKMQDPVMQYLLKELENAGTKGKKTSPLPYILEQAGAPADAVLERFLHASPPVEKNTKHPSKTPPNTTFTLARQTLGRQMRGSGSKDLLKLLPSVAHAPSDPKSRAISMAHVTGVVGVLLEHSDGFRSVEMLFRETLSEDYQHAYFAAVREAITVPGKELIPDNDKGPGIIMRYEQLLDAAETVQTLADDARALRKLFRANLPERFQTEKEKGGKKEQSAPREDPEQVLRLYHQQLIVFLQHRPYGETLLRRSPSGLADLAA